MEVREINWKRLGRKWSWPNLRYYPINYPEGLRKTMKSLSQATGCGDLDSNTSRIQVKSVTAWSKHLGTSLHGLRKTSLRLTGPWREIEPSASKYDLEMHRCPYFLIRLTFELRTSKIKGRLHHSFSLPAFYWALSHDLIYGFMLI
jgi:hypothetical protein